MLIKDVYFIEHCDHEQCSLGTMEFECPACNTWNVEYENYYEEYVLGNHNPNYTVQTFCEKCKQNLVIFNDDNHSKVKLDEVQV